MARDQRQTRRTILGVLLIAALIGGALLVFFLDAILRSFRAQYTVVAVVQNAADLASGSEVWVAGRPVGEVLTVGFMPAGDDTLSRIAVTLELPRHVQAQVRADSRVRLTAANIMSGSVIDILPGTGAAPVLGEGDTLRQELRPTPAQLAARAAGVKTGLDTVLVSMRELSPRMALRLTQTQRAMQGLELAMQEARVLGADMDRNPGLAMLRDPAFSASMRRAQETLAALPTLLENARGQGGAAETGAALARLQARADSLRAQLNQLDLAMNPNGTLARFQQDTALQRAIGAARAQLDSLIAEAKSNPLRFVF